MQDTEEANTQRGVEPPPPTDDVEAVSRADLLWRLMVFQLKLMMDGTRDVVLIPISLIAGLIGVVRGGADADRPFKEVLQFGHRTEAWINLFGYQEGGETADKLIEPLQKKVFAGLNNNPQLKQVGTNIGRQLDKVGRQRGKPEASGNHDSSDDSG